MDRIDSDNVPPELDELGKRMSDARPVADDRTLDRVMTRAQGARRTRKSIMWRSSAPRTPRKTLALAFAALLCTGGMATAASADGLLDSLFGGDIPLVSSLLGGGDDVKAACSAGGAIAAAVNVGSDCTGSGKKKSVSCSSAGLVGLSVNVLSDCTRASSDAADAEYATGACNAAGTVAASVNVLSDCR